MRAAPVSFEIRDGMGLIRLARPDVHNAIDEAAMGCLEAILDDVEAAALRVLVLTGSGRRTFCAGGDLGYFRTLRSREEGLAMSRRMQALLGRLADGPRPVIAAVNGDVWGGGCEILTACHLRLAVAGARFSFRQAAMGVITGWGGGVRLFTQLPPRTALRLLLTAETLDSAAALRLGLIDQVVADHAALLPAACDLARRIAANAAGSVAAFLDLARTVARGDHRQAISRESELFADLWTAPHFRRRVEAWAARRRGS